VVNRRGTIAAAVAIAGTAALAQQAPAPRAAFVDVTRAAGITFVHSSGASPEKRMVESFGSGVAWIDYDNDGFPDLFFVNGAPGTSHALYHNNRNGTFIDVTKAAGIGDASRKLFRTGVAVGDFDNDGYLDLYVTALGPNVLYRNNHNGTFTDVTAGAGVAGGPAEWSTSAGFLDYDRDGDLDLYVVNYLDYQLGDNPYCGFQKPGYRTYCSPTVFDGVADRLFRNNGNGTFTDVSRAAGIANSSGKGLGIAVCDVDRDGDQDIYIANDLVRNFLYRNNGDGTFKDLAYAAGVGFAADGKPQAGMGVDCADVDDNGYPDILVTNFEDELNNLYKNLGDGTFQDIAATAGLQSSYPALGFGAKLFDSDNDGDLDMLVANGHVIDNIKLYRPTSSFAQKPLFYENVGGRFRDVSASAGAALQEARVGRGLAVADMDNDGDLDVAISNQGQAPQLLKNQAAGANWLIIRARGRASNGFGLGARVEIETAGRRIVREINNVSSYLSSNDVRLHAGLGPLKAVPKLVVFWPSGRQQVFQNVAANQILVIDEQ
jgi:enediyne biosynthesis protein E4